MSDAPSSLAHPQGLGPQRLPLPPPSAMTDAQRAVVQALTDGPRKGVFGPFLPLLQSPPLAQLVGDLGAHLRFQGTLPERVRELVICAVSRHVGNQFEWLLHAAAAARAGVDASAIEALRLGRRPAPLADDEQLAIDFTTELVQYHGVSDPTYAAAERCFGALGVVELSTLIGYFAMVCWVMNVARTPGQGAPGQAALGAWPP